MEGLRRLKISVKEAHDTGDHLEVERSKFRVTRPLNSVLKNQLYFQKYTSDLVNEWSMITRITDMRGYLEGHGHLAA